MLASLHWDRGLDSAAARQQLDELRSDALRLFVLVAAVGYLVWHFSNSVLGSTERQVTSPYLVAPLAVPTLLATWLLALRARRLAATLFLAGGLTSITWALYVTGDSHLAIMLAMLALAAGFVWSPLVGLVTAAVGTALMGLVSLLRPADVSSADVLSVGAFALLAALGVWVLMYHLGLTLNWYAESYSRAAQQTREAQEHRAQLVQALKQLDEAYYRLERANSALQLAWKAADAAERSKLEFAANVSHEFRTPLNLIAGYSEMVMTSPESYGGAELPQEYRGDLAAIYRAAQHMLALTDDVLDLARLEVGHLGLTREPIDLLQVVQDSVALIREFVEAKGLELRLVLPSSVPTIVADRLRIRQVLLNLLTNASRFTERGRIEVRVEAGPDDVRVSVVDTGSGISTDNLGRIFERFTSRVDGHGTAQPGVGLGLPISKHIVELHGGQMTAESEPGVGTTFSITLPSASAGSRAVDSPHSSLDAIYRRAGDRVIVVAHPDPDISRLFERHLEGFKVHSVADFAHASALAEELKASAVVAAAGGVPDDYNGLVPIVRCQLPQRSQLSERIHAAAYLVKPVSRQQLLDAIGRLDAEVRRVLIADDDVRFTRLLSRMLARAESSYQITVAHNGDEVLAKLRASPPDLLLLDIAMPGVDGFGVLEALSEEPAFGGVRVIVVSATGLAREADVLGPDLLVHKPGGFELSELISVIGASVSRLSAQRPSSTETAAAPRGAPRG